jgi:hypothetical protein
MAPRRSHVSVAYRVCDPCYEGLQSKPEWGCNVLTQEHARVAAFEFETVILSIGTGQP